MISNDGGSPATLGRGLVRSFAELSARHDGVQLRLVGDGPERRDLEQLVSELNLVDRVTFAGRLTETDTLAEIARSDVLVLPSFMEGLPIVLMEAMALGVPVVASRVAGIPELVEDGVNGLLFAPSDWTELGACIERLLTSDVLCTAFAEEGKKKVADEFDARKSAELLSKLFRDTGRA